MEPVRWVKDSPLKWVQGSVVEQNVKHSCRESSGASAVDGSFGIERDGGFDGSSWSLKVRNTWRRPRDIEFGISFCPFCGADLDAPDLDAGLEEPAKERIEQ